MSENPAQAIPARFYLELLILSSVWGFSFLFLRVAAPEMGPIFLVEMRVASGLVVMLPMCFLLGKWQEFRDNWLLIVIVGITNMAIPFCFFALAALNMSAGLLSIMNATVPFFTAIIGFVLWQKRLSMLAVAGMALGFMGVVVLVFDPAAIAAGNMSLLAAASALFACVLYGLALNLVSQKLATVSGLAITTGSLLISSLILLPLAIWQRPEQMPELPVWAAVIALGVICTGLAYMLFYRLIAHMGSEQAIMTTYLVPLFSILWGNVFLAESITLFMVMGGILVLLGVGMTTGRLPGLNRLLRHYSTQGQ